MQITRKANLNVRNTVEKSVCGNDEFHFFVDELTSRDYMPTYAGMADEKYAYDEMNDEFFEFLRKKLKMTESISGWSMQLPQVQLTQKRYLSLNMGENQRHLLQRTLMTFWCSSLQTSASGSGGPA